jgi:tetratricopeptide (TPR) repeat protein
VTVVLFAVCVATVPSAAPPASAIELLNRYAGGDFEAVVAALGDVTDWDQLVKDLRAEAPAWIEAGGPTDRARRELAVATFALEAARIDEWREWKRIVKPPQMEAVNSEVAGNPPYQPLNALYWGPAPILIEWACRIFRLDETPRPIERIWQFAALGVAQRSEDAQFLIGDTTLGQGVGAGEVSNKQDEVHHLTHMEKRFPKEARFTLAQGIARFRAWPEDAHAAFTALKDHVEVGGEALVRLGEMLLSEGKVDDAIDRFDLAETRTRDPYVLYLAGYLRGAALLRKKDPERALPSFRRAVLEWPGGQSATTSLAALEVKADRREDARRLIADMLRSEPPPPDPWREFVHADDRFWPYLIARLRREIKR